jgi:hypothetical protein
MPDPDLPEDRYRDLVAELSATIVEGDAEAIGDAFQAVVQEAYMRGKRDGLEATATMIDKFIGTNQHYTLDSALTQNIKTVQLATAAYIRDHVRLASLQVS